VTATTRTVLVAEDDASSARILARLLREDGFDVETVLDGASAISRLSRAPTPDILVVDYQLPHVDGLSVARFARSQIPEIRIVVVTAYADLVARASASFDPPLTVLTKPLAYGQLVREIQPVGARNSRPI